MAESVRLGETEEATHCTDFDNRHECPELPPAIWRCVYQLVSNQQDICSGMCVCEMLNAALPELLISASLRSPDSLLCLPAIQAQFSHLILLELAVHLSDCADVSPPADMSSLSFPCLRKLKLTNNVVKQLILVEECYPQLRHLVVEQTGQVDSLRELHLQLPLLLTLEIDGGFLPSVSELASCLSSASCPRLHQAIVSDITFQSQERSCALLLDMPWLERFALIESSVGRIQLRAPRLMELHLKHCTELESFILLPDGDPPMVDSAADASDEEVVVPCCKWGRLGVKDLGSENGDEPWQEKSCDPCGKHRIDVTVCNLRRWDDHQRYDALFRDFRMGEVTELQNESNAVYVEDQSTGYDSDDYGNQGYESDQDDRFWGGGRYEPDDFYQ